MSSNANVKIKYFVKIVFSIEILARTSRCIEIIYFVFVWIMLISSSVDVISQDRLIAALSWHPLGTYRAVIMVVCIENFSRRRVWTLDISASIHFSHTHLPTQLEYSVPGIFHRFDNICSNVKFHTDLLVNFQNFILSLIKEKQNPQCVSILQNHDYFKWMCLSGYISI